jgi:uncharacterized protein HemY
MLSIVAMLVVAMVVVLAVIWLFQRRLIYFPLVRARPAGGDRHPRRRRRQL